MTKVSEQPSPSQAIVTRRALLGVGSALLATTTLAHSQDGTDPASQEPTVMRPQFTFNNQSMVATLYDNPSARDFFSLLPLDLTIDNYANNEKIAYLPRELTVESAGAFDNEQPGDLCYYAPWGNLALFYASYRWSHGLIRLGRFEGGFEPLRTRGAFALRVEAS